MYVVEIESMGYRYEERFDFRFESLFRLLFHYPNGTYLRSFGMSIEELPISGKIILSGEIGVEKGELLLECPLDMILPNNRIVLICSWDKYIDRSKRCVDRSLVLLRS